MKQEAVKIAMKLEFAIFESISNFSTTFKFDFSMNFWGHFSTLRLGLEGVPLRNILKLVSYDWPEVVARNIFDLIGKGAIKPMGDLTFQERIGPELLTVLRMKGQRDANI